MKLRIGIALGVLSAGLLISSISMAWVRYEIHKQYAILQSLKAERDGLDAEWGRLLLEQATWASASRIEQLAHTSLQLSVPQNADVVLLKLNEAAR